MQARLLGRLLFIFYCIEAGVLLALVPWTSNWETALLQLPGMGYRALGLHPLIRGLTSAFGVLHLVWGAHDLELLLSQRRVR